MTFETTFLMRPTAWHQLAHLVTDVNRYSGRWWVRADTSVDDPQPMEVRIQVAVEHGHWLRGRVQWLADCDMLVEPDRVVSVHEA